MMSAYRNACICVLIGTLTVTSARYDVQAQTVLVPSTFADTEGEFSIANTTPVEYRSQQVYASSEFDELPPGTSLLTRVEWRPDGDLQEPETYSADQWIMKFSTSSKNPGELDATFAANIGPDELVVYSGPATISTQNIGPSGGPKQIDYGIDLQVPFPYDPSKGNLLWDLTIIGGSQPLSLDWTFEATGLTSTISTNGDPADSPIASYVQESGGHIAKFTFVPEPQGLLPCVLACFMFLRRFFLHRGLLANTCLASSPQPLPSFEVCTKAINVFARMPPT